MLDPTKIPKGAQSFNKLREAGQIYVDKTDMIFEIAQFEGPFLLARPRRFGKTLLVSTFASLFEHGLRDFQGLKIGSSCIVVGEEPFRQIKSLIEIGPGRFGKGISIAEQNSKT